MIAFAPATGEPFPIINDDGTVAIPPKPISELLPNVAERRLALCTLIENLEDFKADDEDGVAHSSFDYWDQATWLKKAITRGTDPESPSYECGTRACLAGWTNIMDHAASDAFSFVYDCTHPYTKARQTLDLTRGEATYLFHAERDLIDIICAFRYDIWSLNGMLAELDNPNTAVSFLHLQMIRDTHSFI